MDEALVVMQAGLGAAERQACLDAFRAHGTVAATMGAHLCVLRVAPGALAALRAVPGVRCVWARDAAEPPADALPGLGEGERLFVAGWLARGHKRGPRPGDGRDWDAPGFTPPDAP